ncbi:hypothetical protein KJ951_04915, partial [Patescibacteria group bacterium]|nr:hypothetical protein [Patescibacteria group bacterium]MBU1703718.1 hypothetical protein [Patescibacteria group bacterium]MBU1953541.1 hypothetical protein [Patescibacteria group bacterium]
TLESPEQNALLNYAISNQVFSWKNKGFGQSSSGGYTIDLGCDNNNYRINSFDGHEFPVSWEELSYIQDNKDKDILTKKLDKTKNMYCYWRVKYFSDHNVTGSPTAESDVGHFIFTPQTRK